MGENGNGGKEMLGVGEGRGKHRGPGERLTMTFQGNGERSEDKCSIA